jgi:hypothetical protein
MSPRQFVKNPTLRRALWVIGGIVVLALVIFGVAAISSPKQPEQPVQIELSPQQQAAALASQAEAAASREDTAQARQLAEQAIKLDAANTVANNVIKKLDEAAKPKTVAKKPTTQATPATPANPANDPYVIGVKDVGTLLPGDIATWERGMVSVQGGEGLVTYEPSNASAAYPVAVRVTFGAHDFDTAAKANTYATETLKRTYAKEGAAVNVGLASGYTGTDGSRLAVVSFSRGRYAFDALVYGKPGVSVAQMKNLALQLANELPATR